MSDGVERMRARLAAVEARIAEAARRADRARGDIRLVAASKAQPAEAIRTAYAVGLRDFGENYVQELVSKAEALRDLDGIVWHAIGRIQRNKAKPIAQLATVVHAVDRPELATELGRRAEAAGRKLRVLVEVNVAGEASKAGCSPDGLDAVLDAIRSSPALAAVGLMTIPPAMDDAERARPFFAALRELRDRHGGAKALPELSMGMSADFEAAIQEGATLVRIGTAIFGPRPARSS